MELAVPIITLSTSSTFAALPFISMAPVIEFRWSQDDAWYDVKLGVEGDTLVVNYVNFPDDFNEYFRAGDFKSIEEIEALEKRFRPSSQQFQDHQCPLILKDTHLCASCSFPNGDLKFFDATVVEVRNEKHDLDENAEEQCCCTFEIFWWHGQYRGTVTSTFIGSLCKILSFSKPDPILKGFMKLARQCLWVNARKISLPPTDIVISGGPSSSKDIAVRPLPSSSSRFSHKDIVEHSNQSSPTGNVGYGNDEPSSSFTRVHNVVSSPIISAVHDTTSSKGTPTDNHGSSSRRYPSRNRRLSSERIKDRNQETFPRRIATPNRGSSSKKIPISLSSSSKGIPVSSPRSSSRRIPIPNPRNSLSLRNMSRDTPSKGFVTHNPISSSEATATCIPSSVSKRNSCSSGNVPTHSPCMPLEGPANCSSSSSLTAFNSTSFFTEPATYNDNPTPSLREPVICNPFPSPETAVRKRVSFVQAVEVICYVELFSERNDADDQFSKGAALRTFDSSSGRSTFKDTSSFSKRVPASSLSSCKDLADCNTNQSGNEVAGPDACASRRIVVHNTGTYPKENNIPPLEEIVLADKGSMEDKEHGASGHECKWKITWQEWFLEQRKKRKFRCAARTEEGRQNGLCKKNRKGKLEIRLGRPQN